MKNKDKNELAQIIAYIIFIIMALIIVYLATRNYVLDLQNEQILNLAKRCIELIR